MDRQRWQLLEPLLDRALGLSAAEQTSWLEELNVSAPDVAADIAALLSTESIADRKGFLVEPPGLLAAWREGRRLRAPDAEPGDSTR
jgi:predicted component of type VI protein secretion system